MENKKDAVKKIVSLNIPIDVKVGRIEREIAVTGDILAKARKNYKMSLHVLIYNVKANKEKGCSLAENLPDAKRSREYLDRCKELSEHKQMLEEALKELFVIKPMNYDEWFVDNEEEITASAAETGADREMDFDFERYCQDKYEKYLAGLK